MTVNELRTKFNDEFGLHKKWPDTYEVDAETYANVCQAIFNNKKDQYEFTNDEAPPKWIQIAVGMNNGIMFKNVELILTEKKQ